MNIYDLICMYITYYIPYFIGCSKFRVTNILEITLKKYTISTIFVAEEFNHSVLYPYLYIPMPIILLL